MVTYQVQWLHPCPFPLMFASYNIARWMTFWGRICRSSHVWLVRASGIGLSMRETNRCVWIFENRSSQFIQQKLQEWQHLLSTLEKPPQFQVSIVTGFLWIYCIFWWFSMNYGNGSLISRRLFGSVVRPCGSYWRISNVQGCSYWRRLVSVL